MVKKSARNRDPREGDSSARGNKNDRRYTCGQEKRDGLYRVLNIMLQNLPAMVARRAMGVQTLESYNKTVKKASNLIHRSCCSQQDLKWDRKRIWNLNKATTHRCTIFF